MSLESVEQALANRDAWVRRQERHMIARAILGGIAEAEEAGEARNEEVVKALRGIAEFLEGS